MKIVFMAWLLLPLAACVPQDSSPIPAATNNVSAIREVSPATVKPLFGSLKVGTLEVVLEHTSLTDIQAKLGGVIRRQGDAGDAMASVCYRVDGDAGKVSRQLRFMSDDMGGPDQAVTSVAIESKAATGRNADGCAAASVSLRHVDLGVPGIHMSVAQVQTAFGPSQLDSLGGFSYTSEYPAPSDASLTTVQTVAYSTDAGAVTAVKLSQVTSN